MARKTRVVAKVAEDEFCDGSPDSAVFAGKVCSYVESIKWAFKKHRSSGVRPKDAPSEEAWSFYEVFRECEPVDILRFMDRLVPRQVPEEAKKDTLEDYDGRGLCEIYGDMLKEGV